MNRIQTSSAVKLLSLALVMTLLASMTALAAPEGALRPVEPAGETEVLSQGVMYEDEYVRVEYVEEAPAAQSSSGMFVMAASGSVSLSVSTTKLVAGLEANLNVTLTGESIPNGTATVFLSVDGQRVAETPIVNNAARMVIAAAPAAVGTYNLVAWGQDGFIAQTPVEVVAYDPAIWLPTIGTDADGKTVIGFIEPITVKDNTLTGKVTVNGTVVNAAFGPGGLSLILDCLYTTLQEGDKIILTDIKYPRLFPSYKFTFTLMYTEKVRRTMTLALNREYVFAVTGCERENIRDGVYTVRYDATMLELLDAAAQTPGIDLQAGAGADGGITVKSHANGVLVFASTRPEDVYSGTLTLLRFRAKADGETVVTLR